MKTLIFYIAACAAMGLSGACLADDMIAAQQVGGTNLGFLLKGALSNATLSISGPDDFHASSYSKTGAVAIDLGKLGALQDGTYFYQITAATDQQAKVRTPLDNGRGRAAELAPHGSVAMSGSFMVKDGKILPPQAGAKETRRDSQAGGAAK